MKNLLLLVTLILFCSPAGLMFGQTTELFETESDGLTSFTDNSQVFNISSQAGGTFDIQGGFAGYGWNGTSGDNIFVDNDGSAAGGVPIQFTISSSGAVPFIVNNFWIYLSDHNANVAVSGTLTITGKLGGATVYTASQSSGFNTSGGTNNGFTFINMSSFGTQNNASKPVDQLIISTANNFNYVALDAFNWTVTAPEINIKGNSVSIVDGDSGPIATDHTDFGSQSVCSGTIIRTFTIENTGTRAMSVSGVNLSGSNSSDYSVTASPASSVAAGGTTTFQVTFNPSATGTRSATITVNNNDANEAAYDFAIQGMGTDPEVNVQGNSTSIADGDATPSTTDHTDFGSQSICTGTVVRTFTVQNTGNSNLTLGTVTIGGTHAADFSVTAAPASPVSAAGSTTFQVTFNPGASGTRSADISFTTNDCDEATYNFSIQGTGTDPEINVQGNSNTITDGDASPSTTDHTDFGSQSVCSGTIVRTFTIQNTGSSNLTLGTVSISGTNSADFSVTAAPASPVSAAGSTTFQVTFNPTASGTRTADISFTTNDCDEATYDFAIQGTGTDPEINVTGNSNSIADGDATPSATDHTDFGSQDMCSGTIVRTFTIQNTGNSNLTLGTVTIGGTHAADFSVTAAPSGPVSAAGSTTFQVTFNPSGSGTRSADISFTTNDCDEATYNFSIQGTGTDGTPAADDPADITACDSYTLLPLTIGNYFDGPGGTGTSYSAGNVISSDITIYVYAANGICFNENSFSITINTTPIADDPADVTACDSYTLPALTVGNYFDGPGGTGTAYSAGNVISSDMTMYVYAETGTTPNCTDENSFDITINATPVADDPADVTACDSYTLPALTVGNYFDGPGGTGTAYSAGNVISSDMTMYVYAETGTTPNCADENSFDIAINATPIADNPADVSICGPYTLPALTVGNYFDGPGGTGTAYSAGNVISSDMTMYVYAANGSCSDENSFAIDIKAIPTITATVPASRCGTGAITLEATPSAGQIDWFMASSGGASGYTGNVINLSLSGTKTYYVEASDNGCVSAARTAVTATIDFCSQVQASQCGSTLATPATAIIADAAVGATHYRFEIDGTTTVTKTTRTLYLANFTYTYGSTYSVKVAVSNDGTTFSAYGSACNITAPAIPTTQVQASQCGSTLATTSTAVIADAVTGATHYRFLIDGTTAITKTTRTLYLGNFSYAYGATYSVEVAASQDGTTFGAYGSACNITAPNAPATQVQASQCGSTLATTSTAIIADAVSGATHYRFEINSGAQYVTKTTRTLYLGNFTYALNTTYAIRVAYSLDGGSTYQAYGSSCNITSPASAMKQDENIYEADGDLMTDISVEAFPNPNSGDFTITSTHEGTFNLVNELGQLIQKVEFTPENAYRVTMEGLHQGVYFVTGTINSEVITKKIIVQ